MNILNVLFRFLASIKLAVLILLGFVILLSIATFYESHTSTEQVQQVVYQTHWFDLLIFLLGVNVLASALIRYPWTMKQSGFVITHLGILIILTGALITRIFGIEGQITLQEGESTDSFVLDQAVLRITAVGRDAQKEFDPWFMKTPIPAGSEIEYEVGNLGLKCFVDGYYVNPRLDETITADGTKDQPAVLVSIQSANSPVSIQDWLVAGLPRRTSLQLNIAEVFFHGSVSQEEIDRRLRYETMESKTGTPANRLDLYVSPDQILYYQAINTGGKKTTGPVTMGEPFDTTWNGVMIRVDAYYPRARLNQVIVDAGSQSPGPHNVPLVHVRLETQEAKAENYIAYQSAKTFQLAQDNFLVEFGRKRMPLGFTLRLIDFRAPRYPGTNQPARYESDVKLIDPKNQVENEQLVHMNHPLVYNEFKVFQSSYQEGQGGQPDISIFSVSKAPGTPVIYAGSIILIVGMIFGMFILYKPKPAPIPIRVELLKPIKDI